VKRVLPAAGLAGGAVLVASYAAGGMRGTGIAGIVLAVAVLLAARAFIAPARARRRAGGRAKAPAGLAGLAAYREIGSDVAWANVSRRHYDHVTRPRLFRLLRAVAEERYGIDVDREPAAARRLAGDDVWPLLDPSGPVCDDSRAPGVGLATLSLIVERLEGL